MAANVDSIRKFNNSIGSKQEADEPSRVTEPIPNEPEKGPNEPDLNALPCESEMNHNCDPIPENTIVALPSNNHNDTDDLKTIETNINPVSTNFEIENVNNYSNKPDYTNADSFNISLLSRAQLEAHFTNNYLDKLALERSHSELTQRLMRMANEIEKINKSKQQLLETNKQLIKKNKQLFESYKKAEENHKSLWHVTIQTACENDKKINQLKHDYQVKAIQCKEVISLIDDFKQLEAQLKQMQDKTLRSDCDAAAVIARVVAHGPEGSDMMGGSDSVDTATLDSIEILSKKFQFWKLKFENNSQGKLDEEIECHLQRLQNEMVQDMRQEITQKVHSDYGHLIATLRQTIASLQASNRSVNQ